MVRLVAEQSIGQASLASPHWLEWAAFVVRAESRRKTTRCGVPTHAQLIRITEAWRNTSGFNALARNLKSILDVATCHFDRKTVPAQCQKDQWASQPGFLAEPPMEMVHAHEIGLRVAGPVIRIIGQIRDY